jgi:hypothetical protein
MNCLAGHEGFGERIPYIAVEVMIKPDKIRSRSMNVNFWPARRASAALLLNSSPQEAGDCQAVAGSVHPDAVVAQSAAEALAASATTR